MSNEVEVQIPAQAARPLNLLVLHGSVREGRFGIGLAKAVTAVAQARGHDATLIDAKEWKIPLLEKPFHHYKSASDAPQWLADLAEKFNIADAFIVVDGEYNHAPTPGLINLLDHFYTKQFANKLVGLATYGAASGGARSAFVLRNILGELGALTHPAIYSLPNIWSQFDENGQFREERGKSNLAKFLYDFEVLASGLKDARSNFK